MVCHGYAKKPLPKGMAYVMLSRCESIENVFLDDKFKIEDVRCEAVSMLATKRLEESDIAPIIQKQKFDIFYMNIRQEFYFQFHFGALRSKTLYL